MEHSFTEKAIVRAIEGGWECKNTLNGIPLNKSNVEAQLILLPTFYLSWFFDPLFWQALGKAEGWDEKTVAP